MYFNIILFFVIPVHGETSDKEESDKEGPKGENPSCHYGNTTRELFKRNVKLHGFDKQKSIVV